MVAILYSVLSPMNLWFRLLNMLLRRPWRQSVDPFATTVIAMRVWPLDLDLNFHVTNGRYFTMADVGRMDYVLKTGAYRTALRHKAVPIVGDVWGKFRRELRLFERFEIHTRMLGWDEKWLFVEHRFMSKGRVVGVVIMRGVFRAGRGPLPPIEIVRDLGVPEQSPALPDWLQRWSDSCDGLSIDLRSEEGRE